MQDMITFQFEPDLQDIEAAGDKGSKFLKSHGFSDKAAQIPLMILRGLIESSIRIGEPALANNQITVCIQVGEKEYVITVSNPVDETCDQQLMELDRSIQFIRGYQDPFVPYAIQRSKFGCSTLNGEIDCLDLAKIAYKGKALLDFCLTEEYILNLTAVGNMSSADN